MASGETESSLLGTALSWLGSKCACRTRSVKGSLFGPLRDVCLRRVIALVDGEDLTLRVVATREVGFSFLRLFLTAGGSEVKSTGEEVVLVEA